jgi:hypothetical protein
LACSSYVTCGIAGKCSDRTIDKPREACTGACTGRAREWGGG